MVLLERGSLIAGRYRLERALARGGMGSVWVARHLQLDLDVAIKFMAPEYAASAEARARFEREAKASAQLKSSNVVQVHDYGIEGDCPYIVMELLEGEDLEARLRREGRLSIPVTQGILHQVSKALRRAHEVGFAHRDLKPANIFLARQGGEEIVKVLDFGIAKALGSVSVGQATKTGTLIGSPHYMSPEQVRKNKRVDHRSDLWSLGVIAFRCVTGQLPFPGEELGDVLVEICTDPIPAASQVAPDLGPLVDPFFARALQRQPEERFQSAGELADAFAAILGLDRASLRSTSDEASSLRSSPGGAFASSPSIREVPPSSRLSRGSAAAGSSLVLPVPGSTLAPSGNSLLAPPSSSRGVGFMVVLVGGPLLLLIIAITIVRHHEQNAGSTPRPEPSAAPSSAASAPPTPPSPSDVVESAPAANTVPVTSSSALSPRSNARPASPSKGTPRRTTKQGKGGHDPLDSM